MTASVKLNKKSYFLLGILVIILFYYHYSKSDEVSLKNLLKVSVQAAQEGGKLVVLQKNDLQIQSKGKTKEGMDDSVTTADYLSHCAMESVIKQSYPHVTLISEEKNVPCSEIYKFDDIDLGNMPDSVVKLEDVTIWIDPLDATHEYTEKLFQYVTTMVCVAVKGQPMIGVIHNPFNKTTSWAVVGLGNSEDLHKKDPTDDITNKVIISRSHSGTIKEVLRTSCKHCEVLVAAGAGYKALKVAHGDVDAYLHITAIKLWDICAGNAILNALGGKMTTKTGEMLNYQSDNAVNDGGLVATLKYHEKFLGLF